MKVFILEQSSNPNKKYTVIRLNPTLKSISFGSAGSDDFTSSNDITKKRNYLARHKANENWNDSNTAGFWSRHLLWNKPTLDESIKATEKKFSIKIIKAL